MKNALTLLGLCIISWHIYGQGQFNNWYCGYGAGINFNTPSPGIITPNPMYTDDNSATISDANGNLLFFANGTAAYDRNGNVMPNGSSLTGDISAGQTATIVQMPGNDSLYYLFIMDKMGGPNGLTYNVVNMNLHGGLGDIIPSQKNVTILAPCTEKIAPIRHANGVDAWIVIHEWNSDAFRAYTLTSAGLSTNYITTHIGPVASGGYFPGYNAMGQIICNNTNNMIATATYSDGNIQLFDFDNTTGILSNTILIQQALAFGLQFSPNGNLLYATSWSQSTLYQYDLSTYTAAAVSASQVNLGNSPNEGYLQTAPDGKIYVAEYQTNYLGVISSPDNAGPACNFNSSGFYTGSFQSSAGLVDKILVNTVCKLSVHLGSDTVICSPSTITLTDTFSNAHSIWSTGDTTASITVSSSGSYWLQVTQGTCIGRDTINVTVFNPAAAFNLGNDTSYCGSFSRILATGDPTTQWSTGVTASSITINSPGTYWAQISNPCGIKRDSITITQNPIPSVNLGNDTNICNASPLTISAFTIGASYLWQDGHTSNADTVSSSGTYWVAVTVNSCTKRDSIVVSYINPLSFNIGSDTTYCGSFSRVLSAGVANTIWSTGDTSTSITVDSPGTYWALSFACNDTLRDTIIIINNPFPIVNIGYDTTVCPGKNVILNAGNSGSTYQWQNNSAGQIFSADSAGLYWVKVTTNGCSATDSISIFNFSLPLPFSLGHDTTICEDSTILLNAFQSGFLYFWSNGDTTSSIIVNQSGQYLVIDSNICGSSAASIGVTVKQCICKVAIPTAFSPNNDSKNDFYHILTQCPLENFQFNIYNRWGQKIFSAENVSDKWDGTYKGQQQPIGVYVYFLKYTDPYTNKETTQTGNVTLLR